MSILDRAGNDLKEKILSGREDITSLDFSKPQEKEVAFACLEARPQIYALSLDADDKDQRDVLARWINGSYSNILLLNEKQRHKDLVDIYLYRKISASTEYQKNSILTFIKSYDHNLSIKFKYETREGETVCYYDKHLRFPIKLMTSATIRFKVADSLALVKAIDVELSLVDFNFLAATLNNMVNASIRQSIFDTIDDYDLSYFELSKYYKELGERVKSNLTANVITYGLDVAEVNILSIYIPEKTDAQIESQCFAIAEAERVKDYENRMEEISLKHYEKKAEIHAKYPDFPLTLTEAEKDLALNRYLKRNGVDKAYTAEIEKEKLKARIDSGKGTATKLAIEKPVQPKKPSNLNALTIFIVLASVCVAASCLTMLASVAAGLIMLGVVVLGFGLFAAFKWKSITESHKNKKEYLKQEEEYFKALMAYQQMEAETKEQE